MPPPLRHGPLRCRHAPVTVATAASEPPPRAGGADAVSARPASAGRFVRGAPVARSPVSGRPGRPVPVPPTHPPRSPPESRLRSPVCSAAHRPPAPGRVPRRAPLCRGGGARVSVQVLRCQPEYLRGADAGTLSIRTRRAGGYGRRRAARTRAPRRARGASLPDFFAPASRPRPGRIIIAAGQGRFSDPCPAALRGADARRPRISRKYRETHNPSGGPRVKHIDDPLGGGPVQPWGAGTGGGARARGARSGPEPFPPECRRCTEQTSGTGGFPLPGCGGGKPGTTGPGAPRISVTGGNIPRTPVRW